MASLNLEFVPETPLQGFLWRLWRRQSEIVDERELYRVVNEILPEMAESLKDYLGKKYPTTVHRVVRDIAKNMDGRPWKGPGR